MNHSTQKFIILGLALLFTAACGGPATSGTKKIEGIGGEQRVCTMIAASSLVVSVNVPSGWDATQLSHELQVNATVDNQAVSSPSPEVNGSVISYILYEETGSFDITVRLRNVTETENDFVVSKDSSGCHAVGRTLTVDFAPPNRIVLTPGT